VLLVLGYPQGEFLEIYSTFQELDYIKIIFAVISLALGIKRRKRARVKVLKLST
jgi:hypothetical protein